MDHGDCRDGPNPGSEIEPPSCQDSRTQGAEPEGRSHADSESDLDEPALSQTTATHPSGRPPTTASVPEERQELDTQEVEAGVRMPIGACAGSVRTDELRLEEEVEGGRHPL